MPKSKKFLAICLLVFSACGVTKRSGLHYDEHVVAIDAFSRDAFQIKDVFVVIPSSDKINQLEAEEYQKVVIKALQYKGYQNTQDRMNAKTVVYFFYDMSGANIDRYTETIAVPVYNPGQQQSFNINNGFGMPVASGTIQESGTWSTNYVQRSHTEINYSKVVVVAAYENKPQGKALWNIVLKSYDEINDMRIAFPILVSASMDYLTKDPGKRISRTVEEDNHWIEYLKGKISISEINEKMENRSPSSHDNCSPMEKILGGKSCTPKNNPD